MTSVRTGYILQAPTLSFLIRGYRFFSFFSPRAGRKLMTQRLAIPDLPSAAASFFSCLRTTSPSATLTRSTPPTINEARKMYFYKIKQCRIGLLFIDTATVYPHLPKIVIETRGLYRGLRGSADPRQASGGVQSSCTPPAALITLYSV